jgi:small nuclear ribonucleoprotein (snRNP)-like protein
MEYKGKIVGIELKSGEKYNAKILAEYNSYYNIYENNWKKEVTVFKSDIKRINCGPVRVKVN